MESKLDGIAWVVLILSLIAGILILINGDPIGISIGLAVIFQGIIWCVLFLSFAEVIKVLKKIANIRYEGKISGEEYSKNIDNITKDYHGKDGIKCTKCGVMYSIKKEFCPKCYAKNEEYEW